MPRVIAVAALLLLAACTSAEKYQAMLDGWVGAEERELVAAWGPPDSVYEGQDARYLTWTREYEYYRPGTAPYYRTRVVGDRVYTVPYGGTPGYLVSNRCKTTFTLVDARVTGWRAEGDACRS